MNNFHKKRWIRKIRNYVVVLVCSIVVMLISLFVMNAILLRNAGQMGSLLLQNYCAYEENRISIYESLLVLGTSYVAEQEKTDASLEEIKEGLYPYLDGLEDVFGKNSVQIYGIVGGEIISNDSELENYVDYPYIETEWYQKALEANGNIIYTDTYLDKRTGTPNVTIAKKVKASESVLSFDLFLEDAHDISGTLGLPDNSSYYLCDNNGVLLYYDTSDDKPYEQYQEFVENYWDEINGASVKLLEKNVKESDGTMRSLYSCKMSNGWTAVLTIPKENILKDMNVYLTIIIGLSVMGMGLVILMALRDFRHEKSKMLLMKQQKAMEHETYLYQRAMASMAVTYWEIYYIDLKERRYRLLYPSDSTLEKSGDYDQVVAQRLQDGTIDTGNLEAIRQFLEPENIKRNLKHKEYVELKYQRCNKDGKYEWCLTSIMPDTRENGEVRTITMAMRNIESMVRQEEEKRELLNVALQRARAASNAKTDLLSRMSHDIRTPLNAILGLTTVAEMHLDDETRIREYLKNITVSGQHLLGIINQMLDLTKIENGRLYLSEEPFVIDELMDKLNILFHENIKEKQISFEIIKNIEHPDVIGDEGKLSRIVANIVGNAIKYTPKGGSVKAAVTEKVKNGHHLFVFCITDTGYGMTPEFLEKIFEPFEREEETHGEQIEGTGLGMPIAINLAKLMGGDIEVESELGKGSMFRVTIPLKLGEAATGGENQMKKDIEKRESMSEFNGKRILLVEDNFINIEVAKELLLYTGLEVDVAMDGQEAVDAVLKHEPDYYQLIFMDLRMPKMNGYEAAKTIRSSQRSDLESIPIIAMTADAFEEDIKNCRQAGMNAHIAKPIDREMLYTILEKWLTK